MTRPSAIGRDDLSDDLAFYDIDHHPDDDAEEPKFEVFEENLPILELFLALGTQWRSVVLSTMEKAQLIRTGLDYGAIRPVGKMLGIKVDRVVFAHLRTMEDAALVAWANKR